MTLARSVDHEFCCGINVLGGEGQYLSHKISREIMAIISLDKDCWDDDEKYEVPYGMKPVKFSRLYEAIFPDYMLTHRESYEALKSLMDFGFKLSVRFWNSNSGNFVNVYHYKSSRTVGDGKNPLDIAKKWAK